MALNPSNSSNLEQLTLKVLTCHSCNSSENLTSVRCYVAELGLNGVDSLRRNFIIANYKPPAIEQTLIMYLDASVCLINFVNKHNIPKTNLGSF